LQASSQVFLGFGMEYSFFSAAALVQFAIANEAIPGFYPQIFLLIEFLF
jgi:hypothetical protein